MGELIDDASIAEANARYQAERSKRTGGERAITTLNGSHARYLGDPNSKVAAREPVRDTLDVILIGAGVSGLCAATELRKVGVQRIGVLDAGGDFGGVWYWNRYPGAMCDIESYIYMPYLEELGYMPSAKYAPADEIFAHMQRVGRHYDLYADTFFHTTVEQARWDADASQWVVTTDRGDVLRAPYILLANGHLSSPQVPAVPGIETFAGRWFHASRWDFSFTGGDNLGGLDRLGDKAVGVVGTGATALQCVPPLAEFAQRLFVFQRTPSTVGVRANRPTDPRWAAGLRPGWQAERRINFARCWEGVPVEVDEVDDEWTHISRMLREDIDPSTMTPEQVKHQKAINDLRLMTLIRDRVSEIVKDAATAEALKPFYPYACKRPGFHDDYLPAFNRANVTLVDTEGRGLERFTECGIVVNGVEYPVDCIVFATGFDGTATAPRTTFDVVGVDGITLAAKWEQGVSTLYGVVSSGFPNLFLVPFPLSGQGAHPNNHTHLSLNVGLTVARIVASMRANGWAEFDVEQSAEDEWVEEILRCSLDDPEFLARCTPGRGNNHGRADLIPRQNTSYGRGGLAYFEILEQWRADASPRGLRMRTRASSAVSH
jgi:cation diffusion facilitator CzcD-associated flavoprotein CzcO